MVSAPATPTSPAPTPEAKPLSQGARIINTFIAPSKTFTDLRRSAAWWAPFLLMVVVSTALVYTAGQKIGFRRIMENQMQAQPKAQARLENLPAAQRETQMEQGAKVTGIISYVFPVFMLLIWLFVTLFNWATFKVGVGADLSFGSSFAVVVYSALPLTIKTLLATLSVLAGMNPESFSFQNPLASNPGYFMNPADSGVFVYSLASGLDIFMIWTLVLTAIGFTCIAKIKTGTAYAVVFGWWLLLSLAGAGIGAAFS
jgi:hypothetical protein